MLEKGRVSSFQTFLLLVNVVIGTEIMFVPAVASQAAGRDAWLAPLLLGTMAGVFQAFIIGALGRLLPGQTLMQFLETVFYSWPGKICGFFYIFYFLHTNSLIIREFGELLAGTIMPETPLIVFNTIIILLSAYAIKGGLEVLARTVSIIAPLAIFAFVLVIGLSISNMNTDNLLPFFENGLKPVIKASMTPAAWRGEIILLAMLLPFLARPQDGRRAAISAQLFLGLLIGLNSLAIIAIFGPEVERLVFPTFALVQQVGIAFRLDAVAIIVWIISLYGKIALFYYALTLGTAQFFNLKNYKSIVLPLGVLQVILSEITVENSRELVVHISKFWPVFAYLFEYIIPFILLVGAVLRFKTKTAR